MCGGIEIGVGDIITLGTGRRVQVRTAGPCRWAVLIAYRLATSSRKQRATSSESAKLFGACAPSCLASGALLLVAFGLLAGPPDGERQVRTCTRLSRRPRAIPISALLSGSARKPSPTCLGDGGGPAGGESGCWRAVRTSACERTGRAMRPARLLGSGDRRSACRRARPVHVP